MTFDEGDRPFARRIAAAAPFYLAPAAGVFALFGNWMLGLLLLAAAAVFAYSIGLLVNPRSRTGYGRRVARAWQRWIGAASQSSAHVHRELRKRISLWRRSAPETPLTASVEELLREVTSTNGSAKSPSERLVRNLRQLDRVATARVAEPAASEEEAIELGRLSRELRRTMLIAVERNVTATRHFVEQLARQRPPEALTTAHESVLHVAERYADAMQQLLAASTSADSIERAATILDRRAAELRAARDDLAAQLADDATGRTRSDPPPTSDASHQT